MYFRNILMPIDGSIQSKHAVDAVARLCKDREDCKVTLFHTYTLNFCGAPGVVSCDSNAALREEGSKLVKAAARELQDCGIDCETVLQSGFPAEEICKRATAGNYELIVMGSRGLGSLGEIMLGSVSHEVLHSSPCPVLVVK